MYTGEVSLCFMVFHKVQPTYALKQFPPTCGFEFHCQLCFHSFLLFLYLFSCCYPLSLFHPGSQLFHFPSHRYRSRLFHSPAHQYRSRLSSHLQKAFPFYSPLQLLFHQLYFRICCYRRQNFLKQSLPRTSWSHRTFR